MNVPAPHFLLYSEAVAGQALAGSALSGAVRTRQPDSAIAATESPAIAGWRFVLQSPRGETALEAADEEAAGSSERLELLAIVRGLEALDQPSKVTLMTGSRDIQRGLQFGLAHWREHDWQWERYGQMTPVKNSDLWRRVDRLLEIHDVACKPRRLEKADDLAPPANVVHARRGRVLRIDGPTAKSEFRSRKHETHSKSKSPKTCRAIGVGHWDFLSSWFFRISSFVLRTFGIGGSSAAKG